MTIQTRDSKLDKLIGGLETMKLEMHFLLSDPRDTVQAATAVYTATQITMLFGQAQEMLQTMKAYPYSNYSGAV